MISVVLSNEFTVDWGYHKSPKLKEVNEKNSNDGITVGWEAKASEEERNRFFILSAQYEELIEQLKLELKNGL